ncbi:fatty acyl-CoA hydrolase precursor, medium chain-like [Hyperolius riggenbachi]|uniref:fatty acyl-CoA hydrolase precursor, medium chain-like n=1 Tax=Hyperolius riggenbachi TaxID=752182 RepID=UPI0035A2E3AC
MASLLHVLLLWPLVLGSLVTGEDEDKPLVDTKYGKVRGIVAAVKDTERTVHAFYGIPFAKSPTGPLRLAAPEPPEPWSSVREASTYPAMCLQDPQVLNELNDSFKFEFQTSFSEDCLYLNLFTPSKRKSDVKLPVMFFIHGGGLQMGGTVLFEGSALCASEDVVVVVPQYRLGLLGFFSTEDGQATGNYGFLDQVKALEWVRDNIENFGGDPKSVTVFGESAGGFSVSALMLSPLARGLFHRGIAESGVVDSFLFEDKHKDLSKIRNLVANLSSCDAASLVDCLRKKSEAEISTISQGLGPVMFFARVDGEFLTRSPEEMLLQKDVAPVPFMIGVNNHECGWMLPKALKVSGLIDGMDKTVTRAALEKMFVLKVQPDAVPLVMDEYFHGVEDPLKIRDIFLDLCGDLSFVMPALRVANYHRDSGFPVYFYEFQHRPSLFKGQRPDFVKADHGDELFFVTGGPFLRDGVLFSGLYTEEEKLLSKTVMKYWANFARSGDPNGPGLVSWPQYQQDEDYLEIGLQQQAAKKLRSDKFQFWTQTLPEKLRILSDASTSKKEQ